MDFTKDQLPMKQFERLGISKDRLDKLPRDEMHNILSGYPSNMKFLVFKDNEGNTQKVNAKLSIYQNNEGTIGLKVHPYREKIKNDMEMSKRERESLSSGKTINKSYQGQQYLVQLDQSINELRRIKLDNISIAEAVGGTKMSPLQKSDLLEGKPIQMKSSEGRITNVSLDLTKPSGIRMDSQNKKSEKQEINREQKHDVKPQENIRMKR